VLEICSERGGRFAAWASLALVSKIFPSELRAMVLTDCELLQNLEKALRFEPSPARFLPGEWDLEFPGFSGPERSQVRSRLREFMAEREDERNVVTRVVRLVLES